MGPVLFPTAFELDLAHGRCVGIAIPAASAGESRMMDAAPFTGLSPEEESHARSFGRQRRLTWVAGRVAMRAALTGLGRSPAPILVSDRGAPLLPPGVVGSISHKEALAIAMVAPDRGWALGVDLETRVPTRHDISKRILTPAERAEIPGGSDGKLAVKLRFSIKEAIYKAIDPFVRRYVGFQEVEVALLPTGDGSSDGACLVRHHLEVPLEIQARWLEYQTFFIASARARHISSRSAARVR